MKATSDKRLLGLAKAQTRHKYTRRLKQTLVELRDMPTHQVGNFNNRLYDVL